MITSQGKKNNRPPVVGVFGHIDHGKSTLIDYIRKTNIVEAEAGGITQHISAYEVNHELKDKRLIKLTIIDTPGHEAFQSIRTRGATIADIAVLVVSAEDGVKPQTLEVYKHIEESAIPFLVAISKIDKPAADVTRTKQSLAENQIYVEGFGGNTPVVEVSAKDGTGVDELLEMIILMSEFGELRADEEALGEGIILESRLDHKRGIIGVGIIKDGTVSTGLFAATAGAIASIRFLLDAEEKMVEELSFSSPVQIAGWDKMPRVGSHFKTFLKKDEALEFAANELDKIEKEISNKDEGGKKLLPIIIKADTAGSLEALEGEVKKIELERIAPKVILSGVGNINEGDIKNALTTEGTRVFGFNVKTDNQAEALAERNQIEISNSSIIYELTDKIKKLLIESEPKTEVEEITGLAKIIRIFSTNKNKQVAGGRVENGSLEKNSNFQIFRREAEVGHGKIKELQKAKVNTSLVNEGEEFGALLESKVEIVPGDFIKVTKTVIK